MSISYEELREIVNNKLINRTETRSYEELSEILFGEGNCFNESEVRKRMYGMKRVIEIIEQEMNCDSLISNRILAISDAHVPFNLPPSIFKDYAHKVDTLVFNGDTEDCYSSSSFPRKFRAGLDEEMVLTRQYFIDVIELIKPKKVYVTLGNHEARLGKYLTDKLNDDILSIMPDSPLELIINRGFHLKDRRNKTETWYEPLRDMFAENGIEIIYTGDWTVKIGHTLFVHPLTYSSGMLKTTEKAVNYFLRVDRDFEAIIMSHTHRLGSYHQGNIKMYEQGCTCDLSKLDYNNGKLVVPNQNGFMYICHDSDGYIIDKYTKQTILN